MKISKICRLCLKEVIIPYSLLETKTNHWLESLTSIKIEDCDFYQSACVKCWLNLKHAYSIQQTILESNDNLANFDVPKESVEKDDNLSKTSNLVPSANTNSIESDYSEKSSEESHTKDNPPLSIKVENVSVTECALLVVKDTTVNCQFCWKEVKESVILEHIKSHFDTQQPCSECGSVFENINVYRIHVQNTHKHMPKLWICTFCGRTFHYKPIYDLHMKSIHSNDIFLDKYAKNKCKDVKQFKCEECSKVFLNLYKIKTHIRNCHRVRRKCPICQKPLCPSGFQKHVDAHTAPTVICDICGKTSKNLDCLKHHIRNAHSNKEYPCELCDKVYRNSFGRALHTKKVHTKDKKFICEECGKAFVLRYFLYKHIDRTHRKVRLYECEFCRKKFSSSFGLKTHRRQHTNENPFHCVYCGEGFRQKVSLKCHLKSKHDVEEVKTVECKICGKKFANKHALMSHANKLHWGEVEMEVI